MLLRLRPLGLPATPCTCSRAATSASASWHRRERSVFSSTEFWFWFDDTAVHADVEPRERERADRPDGADRGDAALPVRSVATDPETVVGDGRGRGVRRRPVVSRGQLCQTRSMGCRAPGPGAPADGDVVGGGRRCRGRVKDKVRRIAAEKLEAGRWISSARRRLGEWSAPLRRGHLFSRDRDDRPPVPAELPDDLRSGLAAQPT